LVIVSGNSHQYGRHFARVRTIVGQWCLTERRQVIISLSIPMATPNQKRGPKRKLAAPPA
jgi:hypothetical protein